THTDDHPHIPSEDGLSLPLTRQGIQHKEYVPIVSSVDLQMVEYVEVDRTLRQKIRHKLDKEEGKKTQAEDISKEAKEKETKTPLKRRSLVKWQQNMAHILPEDTSEEDSATFSQKHKKRSKCHREYKASQSSRYECTCTHSLDKCDIHILYWFMLCYKYIPWPKENRSTKSMMLKRGRCGYCFKKARKFFGNLNRGLPGFVRSG
ncbi:hypothetical protein ADUPG1_001134, partial [Aduncisulcus paluster]